MTASSKRYLPSHKRVDQPPPIQLTERDIQIVLAVYKYRLLSSHQIEALFFSSKSTNTHSRRSRCQFRLQLLYHHGFLDRLPQPVMLGQGRVPIVYALDEAGANLVASHLGIDWAEVDWTFKHNEVGPLFLEHSLLINNVRIVIQQLNDREVFEVVQWLDEAALKAADPKDKVPYVMKGARIERKYADGYFILQLPHAGQQTHFFLEVDRAKMSNSLWQDKIKAYQEFRKSGQSKRHYGTHNFRVLTVTTGEQRLKNLKRATEQVGGDHFFWFTTVKEVDIWQPETILQPVWSVATKTEKLPLFKLEANTDEQLVDKS